MLAPEDMINPRIDDLSMMTYLSQFPEAELKPGAPVGKRKMKKGIPSKVKVSGPGIKETGVHTKMPATQFTVDPCSAGDGIITSVVNSPNGPIEVTMEPQKNGMTKCSYVPAIEGDYEVEVKFNGEHVGESPYKVGVAKGADASACIAYGPGVEGKDVKVESPTEFWVETAGAGDGDVGVVVRGSKGPLLNRDVIITQGDGGKYHVQYTPVLSGSHSVEVTFGTDQIKDSPFTIDVQPDPAVASKCYAEGPGLEENQVQVHCETWFDVHSKGAGKGDLVVAINGPHGKIKPQRETKEIGLNHFTYMPTKSGEYFVTIKYGGEEIPGSTFHVMVEPPTNLSKCSASGPGLAPQGVRVNDSARFNVSTKGAGHGDVVVTITGPSGEVPCQVESSPYSFDYTYQVSEPGDYVVDITFAGEKIPGAPFPVAIADASKVTISGPGLNGEFLPVNVPLVYTIDARGAGPGELKCVAENLKSGDEEPQVTANGDGTFGVEYTPTRPGVQKVCFTFGEAPVPKTPLKLKIFDASKVKAYGPGLSEGNKSGQETEFFVDMREAGDGTIEITVDGPADTPVKTETQEPGLIKCAYNPTVPGDYNVNIKYVGISIPVSPSKVTVVPSIDPAAVKAYGPGLGHEGPLTTDMWTEFFVDYKEAGDSEPKVAIKGPKGGEVTFQQEKMEDGLLKYRYFIGPDDAGDFVIDITFDDKPIPDSPVTVHVSWKNDPSRVKVYGPGVDGGYIDDWVDFTVDMSEAGEGGLDLQMQGPCEAQVSVDDHGDGTATVKYLPELAGDYKINVVFADQAVPGAPFIASFVPKTNASKVKAYGPGLKPDGMQVGDAGDFVIDTNEAGNGSVDVVVEGPFWHGSEPAALSALPPLDQQEKPSAKSSGPMRATGSAGLTPKITSKNKCMHDVVYNPQKVGTYKISIKFADNAIPDSPFEVNVSDPSKVKVLGPGLDENGERLDTIPVVSISNKEPVCWTAECVDAGPGNLSAVICGVDGKFTPLEVTEEAEGAYKVKFEPDKVGRYRIMMKYGDNDLRQNPIDISLSDSSQVKVTGPGLDGGKIGEELSIDLDTTAAGQGGLALSLIGPVQTQLKCDDRHDGTATLKFTPDVPGEYKLSVKFADEDVPGSTFAIPVNDPTKIKISGSGITGEGARVGAPAEVIVDTGESGPAPIDIKVKNPAGEVATVELVSSEESPGLFLGSYEPTEPGDYVVDAKFANDNINGSPFTVAIGNPDAVRVEGAGFDTAFADIENFIDIYTDGAGPGEVEVDLQYLDESGPPRVSELMKVEDNHYQLTYTPNRIGDLEANVKIGGIPIGEKSVIPVLDLSKVSIEGPGVEPGVIIGEETEFMVDATLAGKLGSDKENEGDDVEIQIVNADGVPVNAEIVEVAPQKWQVKYQPEDVGELSVDVKYCGHKVPDCPLVVQAVNLEAVRAYGDGLENAEVQKEACFTVDASKAGKGDLGVSIQGPADCVVNMEDKGDGIYDVSRVILFCDIYVYT